MTSRLKIPPVWIAHCCLAAYIQFAPAAAAQSSDSGQSDSWPDQRWNLYFQSTGIGQTHLGFPALYSGTNSLPDVAERRVSWTGTIFADFRIADKFDFVVNPEIAGGRGFGYVTGIAGFTNGEIPRVAAAAPSAYVARAFIRFTVPLSSETEVVESGANQLGGPRPISRFTTVAGKFALTDFFDNNTYSHDPRTQFMNWAIMYNGAWDYPADVRGYTVGLYQELTIGRWSVRHATALEPTVANGSTLDTRLGKNRGETVEYESRYSPFNKPGAVRVLGYLNREHAGTFLDSLHVAEATGQKPSLDTSRRHGAEKYGFGLNLEQQIARNIGVFGRYGWSDGKTEAWAFTQIDRSVSGGVSLIGGLWKRPSDHAGVAAVRNYLSGDQRAFLAAGGIGFLIGDGALNYRPEAIVEAYYAVPIGKGFTLTGDYQHVQDPAYNHDRGPVSVYSLRVHWEELIH